MRSPTQQEPGSAAEIEIIRTICRRFHRQGYIQHFPSIQYSKWKQEKQLLSAFDQLKGIDLSSPSGEELLQKFFASMDDNGNGVINKEELQLHFERLGLEVSEQLAEQLLEDADSNHDQQMDFNEFRSLVKSLLQNQSHATV